MKTIKFVPELCKGEAPTFSGEIELKPISFDQRCQYLEEVTSKWGADGKVESLVDRVSFIRKLVSLSKEHYLAVNLTKKSTGELFTSFEDLSYDPASYPILNEVAVLLVGGLNMGNPSKPL